MATNIPRAYGHELVGFHERFAPAFGRREARSHSLVYMRGLIMGDKKRKSVEPLALQFSHTSDGGPAGRNEVLALQDFLTSSPWDYLDVQREVQATFVEKLGGSTTGTHSLGGILVGPLLCFRGRVRLPDRASGSSVRGRGGSPTMPRAWLHVLLMPCGFCLGGVVGAVGAPAWEMAIIFVAFFGGICGALTATLAAAAGRIRWYAPLVVVLGAGAMALLASSNPAWVVIRCSIMVAAAGAAGTVLGHIASLALPAPSPLSAPPQQPPDERV